MRKLRAKLTYSNVISTLCLFLILGGGAYAASRLPKNSVGTKQLKANSVNGSKVKDGSLTGADLTGPVGDSSHAANADHATNADHAGTADSSTHSSQADSATNAGNADKLDGQDSAVFAQVGSEAWQSPTFNDGDCWGVCGFGPHYACYWMSYPDSNYSSVAYFRDRSGVVHLRGLAQAHDGGTKTCVYVGDEVILTLPPGYRPDATQIYPILANDKPGRLDIGAHGQVAIEPGFPTFTDAKNFVSLNGITFRCDPPGQDGCP
jgi:hypothetical protein